MATCDFPECKAPGEKFSRLSPEGFLVATAKKATPKKAVKAANTPKSAKKTISPNAIYSRLYRKIPFLKRPRLLGTVSVVMIAFAAVVP